MKNNARRREREKQEIRLRILDAARELFVQGGEEGLTLRRVAARIEYSATTIYLHFRNKEALVRELCAVDFALFSRSLVQADRVTDPLERLRKVASVYVDFGLQYPSHYRVMFMTASSILSSSAGKTEAATPLEGPRPTAGISGIPHDALTPHDFLHAAVFKAMAAGIFRSEHRDVPLLTQTLWSALHGVVSLHLFRSNHSNVEWRPVQTITVTLVECLLNGMTGSGAYPDLPWDQ